MSRAQSGAPLQIKAADWNRVLDYVNRQLSGQSGVAAESIGTAVALNSTGIDLKVGSPVRMSMRTISGSNKAYDPRITLSQQFFDLTLGDDTLAAWDNLVVTIDPIKSGERGRVCTFGVCNALVELEQINSYIAGSTTNQWLYPSFADIGASNIPCFRKNTSGCARILPGYAANSQWPESGDYVGLAPIILGDRQPVIRCELTENWNFGFGLYSATANVSGNIEAIAFIDEANNYITVEVYDIWGEYQDLGAGDTLTAIWTGENRAVAMGAPPPP